MPKEQRADLHERFAAWLERAAGERFAEYEEILGYHLEQAYRYRVELGPPDEPPRQLGRAAASTLTSSADRARERGDVAGAGTLLRAAVDLGPTDGFALARIRARGDAVRCDTISSPAGRPPSGGGVRARARGPRLRGPAPSWSSPRRRHRSTRRIRSEGSARKPRPRLADLQRLGDDAGVVQATLSLARMAFYEGHCGRSLEITRRLLERAPSLPFSDRRRIATNLAHRRATSGPRRSRMRSVRIELAMGLVTETVIVARAELHDRAVRLVRDAGTGRGMAGRNGACGSVCARSCRP